MALQAAGHPGQVEEDASKHSVPVSTPPVLCLHSSEGDAGAEGSKHTQGVSVDAFPPGLYEARTTRLTSAISLSSSQWRYLAGGMAARGMVLLAQ